MTFYRPHMLVKVRSEAIMREIRGAGDGPQFPCALRVSSLYPGHKCSPGTVVGCHLSGLGKGMSTKVTDIAVGAGCMNCHRIIDGVDQHILDFILEKYPTAYGNRLLLGLIETLSIGIERGVIAVPGAELI